MEIGALDPEVASALTTRLHRVILGRIRPEMTVPLRPLPVEVLHEAGGETWFPVPGVFGDFTAHLAAEEVEVIQDTHTDSCTAWLRPVAADSTACIKD